MTRTAFYQCFDDAGAMIYCGVTDSPEERNAHHRRGSPWHKAVARTDVKWCVSRDHALALERVTIAFERPIHNVQHNPDHPKRVPAFASQSEGKSGMDLVAHIWPVIKSLSDDLGLPYMTVMAWKQRSRIPADREGQVIEAAAKRGHSITREQLQAVRKPRASTSPAQYILGVPHVAEGGV